MKIPPWILRLTGAYVDIVRGGRVDGPFSILSNIELRDKQHISLSRGRHEFFACRLG
jgi:hypothetical protein